MDVSVTARLRSVRAFVVVGLAEAAFLGEEDLTFTDEEAHAT